MLESFFILGPIPSDAEKGVYQFSLVALSYIVASFASYTALSLAGHLINARTSREKFWLHWGGALALGAGIWSMHFIGMLSYKMRMAIEYDPSLTILSMIIAIAASYGAFEIIAREKVSKLLLGSSGILIGIGICSMHYTGMAAMRMDSHIYYKPSFFILSVMIAVARAWCAGLAGPSPISGTTRRTMSCASAAFATSTFTTVSTVTASWPGCQQS